MNLRLSRSLTTYAKQFKIIGLAHWISGKRGRKFDDLHTDRGVVVASVMGAFNRCREHESQAHMYALSESN